MFDIIRQCKRLWGDLRRKNCDKELKTKLMGSFTIWSAGRSSRWRLLTTRCEFSSVSHSSASHEQRQEVFDELQDDIIALCTSQYGKHVVKKMLMYGLECVTPIEKVAEANPDKLANIIEEMKQTLTPMAQKEQVIKHSLVHKVFLDYFLFAPEKQRTEMIESIRESVVYRLTHTTEPEWP
ncbi:hypothetical protein KUCAC02_008600 [Chaenocephalus aceratus]|uniref:Uncharacterized protein n=1 Tax=Chaenocephalus aceratus TaxID=36190 RepID=A0ACB9WQU0_CHAAC|nr:hypothetical protein KUCAC02_008600 [Chaenocephalus aceratus]